MAREFTPPVEQHKIGIATKTNSTQRRVILQEYDDRVVLDIRDWYTRKADEGQYNPGKGITVKVEDIPKLRRLLRKAERIAIEQGYLEAEQEERPRRSRSRSRK